MTSSEKDGRGERALYFHLILEEEENHLSARERVSFPRGNKGRRRGGQARGTSSHSAGGGGGEKGSK